MSEYSSAEQAERIVRTSLEGWASELCISGCKRVAACREGLVAALEDNTPPSPDEPSRLYDSMRPLTNLHNHLNGNGFCESGPAADGECIQELEV